MGRTSCLLVRLLCVINCYLNVIVRLFPCNENKCYLRDEDNCCGSWTWVHFRCSSGTILFVSYAALAPKFEFEWECQRGDLNFNGAWAAASASWADGTVLPAQPSHQPSHLLAIRTGPKAPESCPPHPRWLDTTVWKRWESMHFCSNARA